MRSAVISQFIDIEWIANGVGLRPHGPWRHPARTLARSARTLAASSTHLGSICTHLGGISHALWLGLHGLWRHLARTLARSARTLAASRTHLGSICTDIACIPRGPWHAVERIVEQAAPVFGPARMNLGCKHHRRGSCQRLALRPQPPRGNGPGNCRQRRRDMTAPSSAPQTPTSRRGLWPVPPTPCPRPGGFPDPRAGGIRSSAFPSSPPVLDFACVRSRGGRSARPGAQPANCSTASALR
jgi:hypothetical protein